MAPELSERLGASAAVAAARASAPDPATVWIVGGAVRDALRDEPVTDVDLAVTDGEEELARAIARGADASVFQLSEEFAAWRVSGRDADWSLDVVRLRGGSIEADLGERDFTVNAIALPLGGGDPIDPRGGQADLEARLLRAVSDRSFSDDPLRILRAARIGSALELELDPATVELARAGADRVAEPAAERVFAELRALITGAQVLRGLELLDELGATEVVLPELAAVRGVVQNPNHHLDVHGHTLAVLGRLLDVEAGLESYAGERTADAQALLDEPLADSMTRGGALRFGALLHDLGKPETRAEQGGYVTFIGHDEAGARIAASMCRRLRTSTRLSSHLQGLVRNHLRLGFLVHERPLPRRRVYEYLAATDPVGADVTLLSIADRLAARGSGPIASEEMVQAHLDLGREMLAEALDWHRDGGPEPPLSGDELVAELGMAPGPELGRVLEELRAASFAGEISSRDDALRLAAGL